MFNLNFIHLHVTLILCFKANVLFKDNKIFSYLTTFATVLQGAEALPLPLRALLAPPGGKTPKRDAGSAA